MESDDKPITLRSAIQGAMNPEPFSMPTLGCPIKLGCLIVGLIPVLLFLNCLREPFGPAYVVQSLKPLDLAEAKKLSQYDYPDSARNIRYAHFRQWVGYETLIRFEASVEDCVAFAEKVIDASHKDHGIARSENPQMIKLDLKKPIEHPMVSSTDLKSDWFDIENIHQGLESRDGPSHCPKVWIDTERGVCYMWEHD